MPSQLAGRPIHHYAGYSDAQLKAEPFNLNDGEIKEVRTRLKDPHYDLRKRLAQVDRARRELTAEEEAARPSVLDPLPGAPRTINGDQTRSMADVLVDIEADEVEARRAEIESEADAARKRQAYIDEDTGEREDDEFEANLERVAAREKRREELRRAQREAPRQDAEERKRARASVSTIPEPPTVVEPDPSQRAAPKMMTSPAPKPDGKLEDGR